MVHYCSAFGCKNNSFDISLSFRSFPKEKKLQDIRNSLIFDRKLLVHGTKICRENFPCLDSHRLVLLFSKEGSKQNLEEHILLESCKITPIHSSIFH